VRSMLGFGVTVTTVVMRDPPSAPRWVVIRLLLR
jgi:hypothetical protein